MYYLELRYTNGKVIRLPEPYFMWQEAYAASLKRVCSQYTVSIVQAQMKGKCYVKSIQKLFIEPKIQTFNCRRL